MTGIIEIKSEILPISHLEIICDIYMRAHRPRETNTTRCIIQIAARISYLFFLFSLEAVAISGMDREHNQFVPEEE